MSDNNNNDTPEGFAPFDLYPYNPSQTAAYAFAALFALVGLVNLIAMVPYRSFFPTPMIIGCGMEATAYYFRSRSHDDIRRTLPFLLQNLLLLASPPFLAATVYMSPRRIAKALDAEHLTVSPRWLTKLFVLVDVVCFVTQVTGAILSGSEDPDGAHQGKVTILTGLGLQIVAFCLFSVCVMVFQSRFGAVEGSAAGTAAAGGMRWRRYVYGQYAITVLFVIRNIVRIAEYQQGADGEMLSSEVYLYALDGGFMLAVIAVFLVLHPGRLRMKARRLAKEGSLDERIPL